MSFDVTDKLRNKGTEEEVEVMRVFEYESPSGRNITSCVLRPLEANVYGQHPEYNIPMETAEQYFIKV